MQNKTQIYKGESMKSYNIHLPYFKQGDDLAHYLDEYKNNIEALRAHSLALAYGARQLNEIADILSEFPSADVVFSTGAHMISIEAPNKVINKLLKKELIKEEDWDEEEEIDEDLNEGKVEDINQTNQFYMEW